MASQSKKPKNKDAQLVDLFHHCAHVAVHRGNRSGGRSGTLSALLKTGPVSQRELAEVMNVRAATLSEQIARLDRAGLVERTPSEKDRRSVIVSLSEEGKKEARRCSRARSTTSSCSRLSPTTTRPSSSACSRSSPTTGARAISTAANRSQAARAVRFAPSSAGGAARTARAA